MAKAAGRLRTASQTAADGNGRVSDPKRAASRASRRTGAARDTQRYVNREVSWLDFNWRGLALAEDTNAAVLERAKFLAIVSQNMDEFFQVRVAGLKEQVGAGVPTTATDGMSPADQLKAIRRHVLDVVERQDRVYNAEVMPL